MSEFRANCPNCGAPIQFLWSSAVQTVCEFCRSILVRRDIDLEKVGEVADLPPDVSPIQITTEGVYRNKPFVVVGRIIYQYEQGGWNEWHVIFNDGSSGWLSDAQLEYAVSFRAPSPPMLPSPEELRPGQKYQWGGVVYEVTTVTRARYRGVEGELPFQFWDKEEVVFADLRSPGANFATLDYSDEEPAQYLGEAVEFEDLRLKNLRRFEGWE